jgi:hypothetical protein
MNERNAKLWATYQHWEIVRPAGIIEAGRDHGVIGALALEADAKRQRIRRAVTAIENLGHGTDMQRKAQIESLGKWWLGWSKLFEGSYNLRRN